MAEDNIIATVEGVGVVSTGNAATDAWFVALTPERQAQVLRSAAAQQADIARFGSH